MKKYSQILAAVIFLAGCGVAANAEMRDDIIVKLPFQFVAGEKTLPAGTYRVSQLSSDTSNGLLVLSSYDNGISVFVLPAAREGNSADNPHLSFRQVGEEHFLSTIQTALETYYILVSHSSLMEAAAKLRSSGMSAGGSGSE
jgi:hypothetical protein